MKEETKRKGYWKGKKLTKEHKEKIKNSMLGGNTTSFKKGRTAWNKGKKLSKKHIENLSKSHLGKPGFWTNKKRENISGENCHLWKGGISFEKYGKKWNNTLKKQIRKRDQYRCQECFRHQDELYDTSGRKYKLLVHHIDYNKKNNNPENLISLCRNCHIQTNFNRNDWVEYYKQKIGGDSDYSRFV